MKTVINYVSLLNRVFLSSIELDLVVEYFYIFWYLDLYICTKYRDMDNTNMRFLVYDMDKRFVFVSLSETDILYELIKVGSLIGWTQILNMLNPSLYAYQALGGQTSSAKPSFAMFEFGLFTKRA